MERPRIITESTVSALASTFTGTLDIMSNTASLNIQLTEAAFCRMQEFLLRDPEAIAVRFGIKRTGCSGYGYTVDLAGAINPDDSVFERDGVKVVADPKALPLIDGTEIDFQRDGLNSSFVFRNPNAVGGCGCGESFTVAAEPAANPSLPAFQ